MSGPKKITREGRYRRWEYICAGVLVLLAVGVFVGMVWFPVSGLGPEQPIPISHRLHAGTKGISCLMCHQTVADTPRAGIPSLETCMLCHSRIIIHYPPIEKLRKAYFDGEPLHWKKVYQLPDFVFFDHSVHLHRSVDCERCHGNVSGMDRMTRNQEFTMGFCITCHREYKAKTDCYGCHR